MAKLREDQKAWKGKGGTGYVAGANRPEALHRDYVDSPVMSNPQLNIPTAMLSTLDNVRDLKEQLESLCELMFGFTPPEEAKPASPPTAPGIINDVFLCCEQILQWTSRSKELISFMRSRL